MGSNRHTATRRVRDQNNFRLSAALMAKWDGIILEGTDWRPSTCREDRPVKSSSVPAERRGVY